MLLQWIRWAGYGAGITTAILWVILIWMNPYFTGMNKVSVIISFSMLLLPVIPLITGLMRLKSLPVLLAFIWSLPLLTSMKLFDLFCYTCYDQFNVYPDHLPNEKDEHHIFAEQKSVCT